MSKKPSLFYSEASLKTLAARVKTADSIPGATARRMLENLQWWHKQHKETEQERETLSEFVAEVAEILYGPGESVNLGKALDDLRVINEAAQAHVTK